MLSNFGTDMLEACARLDGDQDFNTIKKYLAGELNILMDISLSMEGPEMAKVQGAALLIRDFMRNIDQARETIKVIKDREDEKRRRAIDSQFQNNL